MRKVLVIGGLFAVMFSGWIPIREVNLWYPQYLALVTVFYLYGSYVLWKFSKPLAVLTFVCLVSTAANGYMATAYVQLVQLYCGCLAAYGISKLNKTDRKAIVRAVIVIVLLQGLYMVVQKLGKDPFFDYHYHGKTYAGIDDTVGFSGSHNQAGLFFAATLPLVLHLSPWAMPVSLMGLTFSTTSFAWLAAIIGGVIYASFKSRKFLITILGAFLIGGIIFIIAFEDFTLVRISSRWHPLRRVFISVSTGKIITEVNGDGFTKTTEYRCNPLTGFGFGNFSDIFPYYKPVGEEGFNAENEKYSHLHNDIGELFFETGYIGLAVILWLLAVFIIGFLKSNKTKQLTAYFCCVLAYLICSTGVFATHVAVSGMLLILFYGLYKGELNEQERQ